MLGCDGLSPDQFAFPAMCKGMVFNRFTAGKCDGRKILWTQVSTDLAVATNLEVIWQVSTFTNEAYAGVQTGRLQPVGCQIVTVANLAMFANDDFFIKDCMVNHAASADDGVEEDYRAANNCAFFDNDARRKYTAFNTAFDDASM